MAAGRNILAVGVSVAVGFAASAVVCKRRVSSKLFLFEGLVVLVLMQQRGGETLSTPSAGNVEKKDLLDDLFGATETKCSLLAVFPDNLAKSIREGKSFEKTQKQPAWKGSAICHETGRYSSLCDAN